MRIIVFGLNVIMATIHPMWAIEEYTKILWSWVWLSPPQPLTIIDRMATNIVKVESIDGEIW